MNEQIMELRKHLSKKLNPARYEHCLSVSYTCIALAMRYGCDIEKSELAGLLHDCAKQFDDAAIIKKCQQQSIALSEDELKAPAVLHAKYGAWLAEHKYQITDHEILTSIQCHTAGKTDMSLLEQILYVADYIEPRRNFSEDLPKLRKLAFIDLDEAAYQIMVSSLYYLNKKGSFINPKTMEAHEYYRKLCKKKEGA